MKKHRDCDVLNVDVCELWADLYSCTDQHLPVNEALKRNKQNKKHSSVHPVWFGLAPC